MEAGASAHYWGREILQLGHEVKLVPPIYVKPFVKWQKKEKSEGKKTGQPPKPLPEPIPDTPENIIKALVKAPPKYRRDWDYLKTKD